MGLPSEFQFHYFLFPSGWTGCQDSLILTLLLNSPLIISRISASQLLQNSLAFHPITEERNQPIEVASLSKHSTKHLCEFLFPSPQSKHCFCCERIATLFCSAAQYFVPLSATYPPIKANSSPPVPETHFRQRDLNNPSKKLPESNVIQGCFKEDLQVAGLWQMVVLHICEFPLLCIIRKYLHMLLLFTVLRHSEDAKLLYHKSRC